MTRRRQVAADAASRVMVAEMGQGHALSIERLWSLCVFFELFIRDGGDGTMEQFGPPEKSAAQVLQLVQ